jgi:ring-1,2-phenylacetyl-CoA epoxidase subunit PaaD
VDAARLSRHAVVNLMLSEAQAWQVLQQVPDPEIPVISVCDLGIVREVRRDGANLTVVVTPTYSGCPATELIRDEIRAALASAGAEEVIVETRLSPAWSTDWISTQGREKLRAYGIVPPHGAAQEAQRIRIVPRALECPRCGARETTRLSQFGSTACKALWRCERCREPFEYFKPI